MSPKVPLHKCANLHCHRHVHGNAVALGGRHCRTCVREFRYAFRKSAEFAVGNEVGRALAKFYTTPNNLGATP